MVREQSEDITDIGLKLMSMDDNWSNLLPEILILIFKNLELLDDCLRFVGVCKSWRNSVSGFEMPCFPPTRYPFLLLAEDVAPGVLISDCEFDSDQEDCCEVEYDYVEVVVGGGEDSDEDDKDSNDSEEEEDSDEDDKDSNENEEEEEEEDSDDSKEEEYSSSVGVVAGGAEDDGGDDSVGEDSDDEEDNNDSEQEGEDSGSVGVVAGEGNGGGGGKDEYNYLNNTIGSSRGLYSLLTGKTYIIDLPEAAGRLIVGTNIGWLVTLGRDLQVKLLHPLLRQQISLPPMLSFPRQCEYHEYYPPEEASEFFIWKVVVSSKILNKNTAFSLYSHQTSPSPILMALYGQRLFLGFLRLGDKVWTDVKLPVCVFHNIVYDQANFEDIAYHKGNFYVVDCHGGIFVCGNDDNEEGGDIRGRQIASLETKDRSQKYLVESSSGSGLWLLVRYRKKKVDQALLKWPKYRTTNFLVWRLDLKYSDSLEDISCTLTEEKYLRNEVIFIGRSSSIAVSSSSGMIKPNSIYFTDDNREIYHRKGGGHDMGIFNIERRTIEPHFPGKSIHPISPPLWYF